MISDKIEMIEGAEVYVGSKSFHQLEQRAKDLIGFRF
jgi:tryptophanase